MCISNKEVLNNSCKINKDLLDNNSKYNKDELKIYNRLIEEFKDKDKVDDIMNNLDSVYTSFKKYKEDKELGEEYLRLVTSNKKALSNILIAGESFNYNESFYYSNAEGYLCFENISNTKIYTTRIKYDELKEFNDQYPEEMAILFCYIETDDEDLMLMIKDMSSVLELNEKL